MSQPTDSLSPSNDINPSDIIETTTSALDQEVSTITQPCETQAITLQERNQQTRNTLNNPVTLPAPVQQLDNTSRQHTAREKAKATIASSKSHTKGGNKRVLLTYTPQSTGQKRVSYFQGASLSCHLHDMWGCSMVEIDTTFIFPNIFTESKWNYFIPLQLLSASRP
jgi:hypothetical protein